MISVIGQVAVVLMFSDAPVRASDAAPEPNNPHALSEMADAWKKRASVRTGKVHWHVSLLAQGALLESGVDPRRKLENDEIFWFGAGTRRRHHVRGTQPNLESGGVMTVDTIYTDDGEGGWRSLVQPNELFPSAVGAIKARTWGQQSFLPILLHFAKHDAVGADVQWKVLDAEYVVDARRCFYLESNRRMGQRIVRIVVDPDRQFSIVQFDYLESTNRLLLQFQIHYEPDPVIGWIPKAWTHANWNGDGTVRDFRTATVLDHQFDAELPLDTFNLRFPDGTHVQDERQPSVPLLLAQPDGSLGKLESEVDAVASRPNWSLAVLLLVFGILAALVAWGYRFLRR